MAAEQSEDTHVLIVEDDEKVRTMLLKYLSSYGFTVSTAGDVESARGIIAKRSPDIVLLDISLNGKDGLDVIRGCGPVARPGFIIVSGRKTIFDRVVGLELGADDYLTKPFSLRELVARVKALQRRRREAAEIHHVSIDRVATFAGWSLNIDCRQLLDPQGHEVPLTTGEYNLLHQFVMRPGRVLNRDQLMDLTRERDRTPFDRTIDAQVSRLRRKIEGDSRRPQLVKSVHGAGYIFSCKVDWTRCHSGAERALAETRQIEIAA